MSKKTLKLAVDNGNDRILQVKSNQQYLLDEIDFYSKFGKLIDSHESIEKGHGRIETRKTKAFAIAIDGWEQAVLGCCVFRHTILRKNNQFVEEQSNSYYLCNKLISAKEVQDTIRNHWGIEATDHNIRDTVLLEDANNASSIKLM